MKRNSTEKYVAREVRSSVGNYETEKKEKKKLDRERPVRNRVPLIFSSFSSVIFFSLFPLISTLSKLFQYLQFSSFSLLPL